MRYADTSQARGHRQPVGEITALTALFGLTAVAIAPAAAQHAGTAAVYVAGYGVVAGLTTLYVEATDHPVGYVVAAAAAALAAGSLLPAAAGTPLTVAGAAYLTGGVAGESIRRRPALRRPVHAAGYTLNALLVGYVALASVGTLGALVLGDTVAVVTAAVTAAAAGYAYSDVTDIPVEWISAAGLAVTGVTATGLTTT
ncbi:MAG: hypothetical protein ACLFMT_04710, partial [Halobacteriales archaeon]